MGKEKGERNEGGRMGGGGRGREKEKEKYFFYFRNVIESFNKIHIIFLEA